MPADFSLTPSSVQFFITADVDPGAIARVTELFALRGLVPDFLKVSRYKKTGNIPESLSIDVRVSALDPHDQDVILNKLNAIISVVTVRKEVFFAKQKAA
ncbi:MAG: hypothetical protein P8I94_08455 [Emcibacteraceae bacterium]|nr:hypothetical protein [Emcibacteraceae bacterium]